MYREILYSIIGHGLVFGGLVFPSLLDMRPRAPATVYTVRAVSPQAIKHLLEKSAPAGKPKPKLPQVKVRPDRPLPKKNWRPRQRIKKKETGAAGGSSVENAGKKARKGPVDGMKVDQEFDYPDYLIELRDRIERNWRPPTLRASLRTRVYFRIARNGRVLRSFVETKTGNMAFDMAAMNAVIKSAPFPPLPGDYPGEYIGIHMDFIYEM